MALSAFADKSQAPQSAELHVVLGRSSARWDDLVAYEDLNVQGLVKMSLFSHPLRKLAKSISDAG